MKNCVNGIFRYDGRGRVAGFTLIELMVVVTVVAILVAVAYPSYQDSIRKSHRAQAKADLLEYAQLAERFRTVNNTYVGAGNGFPTVSPREPGAMARYSLTYTATQSTFTLTATPSVGGSQVNDQCGTLRLNQAGRKGSGDGTAQNPNCF